jgi:prepilin-type N-terminal cleavage/methylation domain-containing protein
MNRCGFSLIELTLVVALVALIATLCVYSSSWLNHTVAHTQLEQLQAACRACQCHAIATKKEQRLVFDNLCASYEALGSRSSFTTGICGGCAPGMQGPPSKPVAAPAKCCTFEDNTIIFYPDGIISSGVLYLLDTKTGRQYALSSGVGHTSFLRLYSYDGVWRSIE